jgi:hypothetical protein
VKAKRHKYRSGSHFLFYRVIEGAIDLVAFCTSKWISADTFEDPAVTDPDVAIRATFNTL